MSDVQMSSPRMNADGNSRRTILVVEDDPDIVLALTVLLEDAGYRVETSETGDELAQLAHDRTLPDLILLDMLLSGRDGREIAAQLKEQPATSQIPILMLSAHPSGEQEAQRAGADGFVAKPFDVDELLRRITAHLR